MLTAIRRTFISALYYLVRNSKENRKAQDPRLEAFSDLRNSRAWDRYWDSESRGQLSWHVYGLFCDDRDLIEVMTKKGMKKILCVGNGVSLEPKALSQAGFQVVVLDISSKATEIAKSLEISEGAFSLYCDSQARKSGGSIEYVVGDLLDPTVCKGPFDVIIERRTAQLYFDNGLDEVLNALADRMNKDAILFSHCHMGLWRPEGNPFHPLEFWFRENGWPIVSGEVTDVSEGKVAWLFSSTG